MSDERQTWIKFAMTNKEDGTRCSIFACLSKSTGMDIFNDRLRIHSEGEDATTRVKFENIHGIEVLEMSPADMGREIEERWRHYKSTRLMEERAGQ